MTSNRFRAATHLHRNVEEAFCHVVVRVAQRAQRAPQQLQQPLVQRRLTRHQQGEQAQEGGRLEQVVGCLPVLGTGQLGAHRAQHACGQMERGAGRPNSNARAGK